MNGCNIIPWKWEKNWLSPIHLPEIAARGFIKIISVRVERLKDISEADVLAEGLKKITKDNGRTWKFGLPDYDGLQGRPT